jgi:hypothetical protein
VTAIGGGGGAAAAARVTGCQLGLGRLRGRDELVGLDGIKKCEISQLKSLKAAQLRGTFDENLPPPKLLKTMREIL